MKKIRGIPREARGVIVSSATKPTAAVKGYIRIEYMLK